MLHDDTQRRDRKCRCTFLRERYGAFKGSDPMPSSLMKRATGCAQKRGRKMFSRSPMSRGVGWCCVYLLSPFGSAGGDRTRRNSHDERDGDAKRGVLVRIRDRSIAREPRQGWGRKASKQASKHGQGSKAGRQARKAGLRNVTYSSRPWLYWSRRGGTAEPPYASISVVGPVSCLSSRLRGREGGWVSFLRSPVLLCPSFLWYWPQPPCFQCWRRNAAITNTDSSCSSCLTINVNGLLKSIRSRMSIQTVPVRKMVQRLALSVFLAIDFSRFHVFMPWIIYADNFVPISLPESHLSFDCLGPWVKFDVSASLRRFRSLLFIDDLFR